MSWCSRSVVGRLLVVGVDKGSRGKHWRPRALTSVSPMPSASLRPDIKQHEKKRTDDYDNDILATWCCCSLRGRHGFSIRPRRIYVRSLSELITSHPRLGKEINEGVDGYPKVAFTHSDYKSSCTI